MLDVIEEELLDESVVEAAVERAIKRHYQLTANLTLGGFFQGILDPIKSGGPTRNQPLLDNRRDAFFARHCSPTWDFDSTSPFLNSMEANPGPSSSAHLKTVRLKRAVSVLRTSLPCVPKIDTISL